MRRVTKKDKDTIESLRKKKARTTARVYEILTTICEDNPEIFKKLPEKRVKKAKDIIEKIKTTDKANIDNFQKYVKDIAGTRLTCCTLDEIVEVQNRIENHPDILSCKVLRTYNDKPDKDGYRGHHLQVKVKLSYENRTITDICEIQIRTLASDLWAVLSHRDIYKSYNKPTKIVMRDMQTLAKQLEIVDDFALSLKERIREELTREAREKAKDKTLIKDMLTPENIQRMIKKIKRKDISPDFAYKIIRTCLQSDVSSLKEYEKIIKKKEYLAYISEEFTSVGVKPNFESLLLLPVHIHNNDNNYAKIIVRAVAKLQYKATMANVEKGVDISKDELQRKEKTPSISRKRKR